MSTQPSFPTADELLDTYPLPEDIRARARIGLVQLLAALEAQVDLNANGRARELGNIHDDLRRLKAIVDDRRRFPEIAKVEIKQPLFILGLPRCGTSLLQALMGSDPNVRTPLMWEVANPSPPPEAMSSETDPRIAQFDAYIERHYGGALSEARRAHPVGAMIPQECGSFMTSSFHSSNPSVWAQLPGFYQWFLGADLTFRYEVHKMWLQHLSWKNARQHWVLKIQEHMYSLPELLSVYPDAIFVQPHRDPTTVIASISELIRLVRVPVFDIIDLPALGREMLHFWNDGQMRLSAYRAAHPDLPIYDLAYKRLVKEPVQAVRGIYEHFGWNFTDESKQQIEKWLKENPADKHGKHSYSLATFGLTDDDVRTVYADYIESYREFF